MSPLAIRVSREWEGSLETSTPTGLTVALDSPEATSKGPVIESELKLEWRISNRPRRFPESIRPSQRACSCAEEGQEEIQGVSQERAFLIWMSRRWAQGPPGAS